MRPVAIPQHYPTTRESSTAAFMPASQDKALNCHSYTPRCATEHAQDQAVADNQKSWIEACNLRTRRYSHSPAQGCRQGPHRPGSRKGHKAMLAGDLWAKQHSLGSTPRDAAVRTVVTPHLVLRTSSRSKTSSARAPHGTRGRRGRGGEQRGEAPWWPS